MSGGTLALSATGSWGGWATTLHWTPDRRPRRRGVRRLRAWLLRANKLVVLETTQTRAASYCPDCDALTIDPPPT